MEISAKCVVQHRKVQFPVSEQKSTVIFDNPALLEVQQIEVDGCVFTQGDHERCDWLLVINGNDMSVFVELKGSDIDTAIRQLAETQTKLPDYTRKHRVWIVSYSAREPSHTSTLQVLKYEARKKYSARLLIEKSPYNHTI